MNREEHLLVILNEECSEVSKEICKALRFGLNDYRPGSSEQETNRLKISEELTDLIAVATMLKNEGFIDDFMSEEKMLAKMHKVEYYMKYSKNAGKMDSQEQVLKDFADSIISESKDLDPEIAEIVNRHYKKLLL